LTSAYQETALPSPVTTVADGGQWIKLADFSPPPRKIVDLPA